MRAALRASVEPLIWAETDRQTGNALLEASRDVEWRKQHVGAVLLTESVTSGYAYWSFELHPSHGGLQEHLDAPSPTATPATLSWSYSESLASRRPPKLAAPLMTADDRKKNDIVGRIRINQGRGAAAAAAAVGATTTAKESAVMPPLEAPSAPAGSVPLWAMGHHPGAMGKSVGPFAPGQQKKGYFGNRRRGRVPHLPHVLGKVRVRG